MKSRINGVIGFTWVGTEEAGIFASEVLSRHLDFRPSKRPCPVCKFRPLIVSNGDNLWCVRCHLMAPNNIFRIKSGKRVKF
jgi:hypothetical protein